MDTVTLWVMDNGDDEYMVLTEGDMEESFTDMVNDSHPAITLLGTVIYPADAVKQCDPTAWREAFHNYCDAMEYEEIEMPLSVWHSDIDVINEWIAKERNGEA